MLYPLIRPLLFGLSPETAHDLTMKVARLSPTLGRLSGARPDPRLSIKVGKVSWSSPVGLAAGLDKNAEALEFFSNQGFGCIECGTITLRPQIGNPRPRIFRYPEEESLRNAMGFPNDGLVHILSRLKAHHRTSPIGANIGKNKESTPAESIEELTRMMESLHDVVDYFVVNVSSPNTPGLRALQEAGYLTELFTRLNEVRSGKDLYLKIAPDLEKEKVIELTRLAAKMGLTGIVATNTTIMPERGAGGVSGRLLTAKAREVRQVVLGESLPLELIGAGGISSPRDLFDLWLDGGKAAQVYTGYIYQGPQLLKKMQHEILRFLDEQRLKDLQTFFDLPFRERCQRIGGHRVH